MRLKGVNKVKAAFKDMGSDIARDVRAETAAAALNIQREAMQNAPRNYLYTPKGGKVPTKGEIAQSISAQPSGLIEWSVSVNSKMGAYAEFGTGAYVEVPPGWEGIAWSYYVNGKGLMMPQPYFYPAWIKGQAEFIAALKLITNKNRG